MTWEDVINTLIGAVAGGALAILGGWLKAREETKRYLAHLAALQEHAKILAGSPEEARDEIEKHRPSNPPAVERIGILLLVSLGSGMLGGLLAPHVRALPEAPPQDVGAATAGECKKASDCGAGCSCPAGQCKCAAIERRPPPKSEPRSASASVSLRDYAGDPFWGPVEPVSSAPN